MLSRVASKVILLQIAACLSFFGIGALAFAIWTGLSPSMGEAWAAALTALILLIAPLTAVLVLGIPRRKPKGLLGGFGGEETAAAMLTGIVRDRPFLLLLGAALLGAADAFFKKRK
ncbi:MAG TPA: hypothetical protein VGF56_02955 [Rhizomicrobium sp.]|jgi:hypothetical protein